MGLPWSQRHPKQKEVPKKILVNLIDVFALRTKYRVKVLSTSEYPRLKSRETRTKEAIEIFGSTNKKKRQLSRVALSLLSRRLPY